MLPIVVSKIISFSGAFSISSASSPVTSNTRTIRASGVLKFDTVTTDSGTPQYSKNAAAYSNITEGMTLTMSMGDTLAVKATLPTTGQKAQFNVKNNVTSALIEAVVLEKL